MNDKGADKTARRRRLVCTFVVRKQQSQGFSRRGTYDIEAPASAWLRACVRKEIVHNSTEIECFGKFSSIGLPWGTAMKSPY